MSRGGYRLVPEDPKHDDLKETEVKNMNNSKAGSANTSTASKTWSINTSPTCCTPTAGIPFEEYGLGLVAHHYNVSAGLHRGSVEAIYTSKTRTDCEVGACAFDLERGIVEKIWPDPW